MLIITDNEAPDRALAQRRRVLLELLPAAMPVLERRRSAGTLLLCAPHELEWSRRIDTSRPSRVAVAHLSAPVFALDMFLKAARMALAAVTGSSAYGDALKPSESMCTQCVDFVVAALDLMSAPRLRDFEGHTTVVTNEGGVFVRDLHLALDVPGERAAWLSRGQRDMLLAARKRLRTTCVTDWAKLKRDAEASYVANVDNMRDLRAKAQADNAAAGLNTCAHCSAREVNVAQFKRCGACKGPVYCSKDCQLAAWPAHKAACKVARKAAAAAASTPDDA